MQKITPFLWFNNNAEEAMKFYTTVFKDADIMSMNYINQPGHSEQQLMIGSFKLYGQEFMVINGGPLLKFSQAISFFIHCDDQEEIDHYWNELSSGGEVQQCGWLIDKFGITWQVVPKQLGRLMSDPDRAKANRVQQAMLKMKKIIIAELQAAYDANPDD